MGKIIYEDNNGKQTVLRQIDKDVIPSDVLLKQDYFARKLWCREDIELMIEEMGYKIPESDAIGYSTLDALVDEIIKEGGKWNGLTDCNDSEWDIIKFEIEQVMQRYGWGKTA